MCSEWRNQDKGTEMGTDQLFHTFKQSNLLEIGGRRTHETVKTSLMDWLLPRVAAVLDMPQDSIDIDRNLEDYGLDSLQAVGLAGDLQSWLGIDIPPTVIWDYPSIGEACDFLARLIAAPQAPARETNGDAVDLRRKA
jgi:acyl carrier protein